MSIKTIALTLGIMFTISMAANAQGGYRRDQMAQETMIKKAYKRGRVTPNEYRKLMREQDIIRETIRKAKRDGVIDRGEQERIDSKLDRAAERLDRYKTNWER